MTKLYVDRNLTDVHFRSTPDESCFHIADSMAEGYALDVEARLLREKYRCSFIGGRQLNKYAYPHWNYAACYPIDSGVELSFDAFQIEVKAEADSAWIEDIQKGVAHAMSPLAALDASLLLDPDAKLGPGVNYRETPGLFHQRHSVLLCMLEGNRFIGTCLTINGRGSRQAMYDLVKQVQADLESNKDEPQEDCT